MILAAIPPVIAGVIAFIKNTSPWQFALIEAVSILITVTAITFFFRPKTVPSDAQPTPDPSSASKLQFGGDHNRIEIGPGIGNEAILLAIDNVEHGYDYRVYGVKAKLAFTHIHSGETFTMKGWFASIDNGRIIEKPIASVNLDSGNRKRAWLILYVNSNIERGQYRFAGPVTTLGIPISGWTLSLNDNNRLSFGDWQVKIAITSDGCDRLERVEPIQADGRP